MKIVASGKCTVTRRSWIHVHRELGFRKFETEESRLWWTKWITQRVVGREELRAMTASRQSPEADLNALVPAYLAATPEQKREALAILRGQMQEEAVSSRETEERMLNQQEVAHALHVHTTTVRRWRIPCRYLGRLPRYAMDEVQEYLGSREFKRRLAELKEHRTGK